MSAITQRRNNGNSFAGAERKRGRPTRTPERLLPFAKPRNDPHATVLLAVFSSYTDLYGGSPSLTVSQM